MPETNPKEHRHTFNLRLLISDYYAILRNKHFILNTLVVCSIYGGMVCLAYGRITFDNRSIPLYPHHVWVFPADGVWRFCYRWHAVKYAMELTSIKNILNVGLSIAFWGLYFLYYFLFYS